MKILRALSLLVFIVAPALAQERIFPPASQAEVNAGILTTKFISPATQAHYSALSSTNGRTFYVAPWGNNSWGGTNENIPLAQPDYAATVATNWGDTIVLMPGVNTNTANQILLSPGVGMWGMAGSLLVISNQNPGSAANAYLAPNSFCTINNVRIWFLDPDGDSDCPVGIGTGDNIAVPSVTNCVFNNLWLHSDGTGIHFEGIGNNKGYDITFNNPYVFANDCCFELKQVAKANIKVNNPTFVLTNYSTGGFTVGKPLRVLENTDQNASSHLVISGGTFTYSDTLNSTNGLTNGTYFPAYAVYSSTNATVPVLAQSNIVMNGVTLCPLVMTNPNSADVFGCTNHVVIWKSVIRWDALPFTETNTFGSSSIVNLN